MNWHSRWVLAVCAAVILAIAPYANASQSFDNDRGDIAARISMQNTFQHNGVDSINWVQWRNEIRFDIRYDIIQQGVGAGWGPIKQLKFNFLYRGRIDPVYMVRDSYSRRDYDRGNYTFPEGKTPRELFFDVGFDGALKDLSMRIGKQQVVWGEADLFRSLDIVNPLDIRQNGFVGEDFADIRQPLWIAKFLYNFGSVASFWNEAGVEAFYSPNSRPEGNVNNIISGETWKINVDQSVPNQRFGFSNFNRNSVIDFNQVRHPWEINRVGIRRNDAVGVVQNGDGSFTDFMYRIKNDVPPSELSLDAQMAGVRLLGTTYGNAYFTLNYLFKRTDATSASALVSQLGDPNQVNFGALQPAVLNRAVEQTLTPDLNGNGIPDGQEQQIENCIMSRSPTGTPPGLVVPGVHPLLPGAGEIILDPHGINPTVGVPGNNWHGSVRSDNNDPRNAVGIQAGTNGNPGDKAAPSVAAGTNQLRQTNLPTGVAIPWVNSQNADLAYADGLSHSTFCADIPAFHPWTHIIGGTMTYNDYEYTGLVFRLEQSFSTKEPRQLGANSPTRLLQQREACTTPTNPSGSILHHAGGNPVVAVDSAGVPLTQGCINSSAWTTARDYETRLKRYTQTWRSMVGFDYLRAIAPQVARNMSNPVLRSLLADQWFFTFQFLNTYDAHANDSVSNAGTYTDRQPHWNPFFTVSGSGFFLHQTLAPIWAVAADASTGFTPLFFLQIKYFITPKLELRVGEVLYMGSKNADNPSGLNYYADRDNLYFRLTYYLL